MKLPPVGWAFFALAVLALIFYGLDRGIFIGSEVRFNERAAQQGGSYYSYECRYLYLSGIRTVFGSGTGKTEDEAASEGFCPTFGPNPGDR
jgi:hypothetical protein